MTEILTPALLIEQPWRVYDAPAFYDEWEEFMSKLPKNMTFNHHIGTRSLWETYIWSPDGRHMHRQAAQFAPLGMQLEEDEYAEAFERAKQLADQQRVHHVRFDLQGAVEETWRNTPYKHIEGHSFHKIPPYSLESDYIEVDGKLWHVRDYYEQEVIPK